MATKSRQKYVPGTDGDAEEIFRYPFTVDDNTINFLIEHGRIMFIVRGPPGTGKESLTRMLLQRYPNNTICSADKFFQDTFTTSRRDQETLKRSHEFCQKMVEKACLKDTHCIIVKNTHMKKRELQRYLDFAAQYKYTVIMAITTDKFQVSPEILAKSNTKGLNVKYFENRLKQWEDVTPVHSGWFLSPDDSSYLLSQLEMSLDSLLGDGKFCRIMNAFCKDELLKQYKVRELLYCIAACGENNTCDEIKSYYLSPNVKNYYGQCFTITIQGYLVTPSFAVAVVQLDETTKNLRYIKKGISDAYDEDDDISMLVRRFKPLHVNENFKNYCSTIDFNTRTKREGKTAALEKVKHNEAINLKYCSFIQLAERSKEIGKAPGINSIFKMLASITDENRVIDSDKFVELEDNFKVCRSSEAWFVKPPFKVTVKTVFTGLYV